MHRHLNRFKNKKSLIALLACLGIILTTVGITVAWFTYSRSGIKENTITSGSIKFHYAEGSRTIDVDDMMPMTDIQGKAQNDYFEFTVDSKTSDTVDIPYYITASRSGTGTNMDGIVKVYLTKVDKNNNETEVTLSKFSNLGTYTNSDGINIPITEKLLYRDKVYAGTSSYTQKYRLRIWIASDAEMLVQENGTDTYPYEGKTYTVKVNVYANGEDIGITQKELRENVDIEDVEIDTSVLTTSTTTFTNTIEMPVGETTMTKQIEVNTTNPDSIVAIENLTSTASLITPSNIKRLATTHTLDLIYGTNTFKITVTSITGKTHKDYTLVVITEYPSYQVDLTGSNVAFGSGSIQVGYGDSNAVRVTPATGYYLSKVSCTNGYTTNATVGTSATSSQTVRISNNDNTGGSLCTFATTQATTTVTMLGDHATYGSNSIAVNYNSYNTVTVQPDSGYYLESISCSNSYTNNATTGISATGQQTVRITNPGNYSDSTCTVTMKPYYTSVTAAENSFTSSEKKAVIMCDYASNRFYNCGTYTTFNNALASRNTGYIFSTQNIIDTAAINVASNKNVTIDLNGKTLDIEGSVAYNSTNYANALSNSGTLTLTDSKGNGEMGSSQWTVVNYGTITINSGKYYGTVLNLGSNNIRIDGGTFYKDSSSLQLINNASSGNINIYGGNFSSNNSSGDSSMVYSAKTSTGTINLYGGIFTSNNNGIGCIRNSSTKNAKINIRSGATINCSSSTVAISNMDKGIINVIGATINATNANTAVLWNYAAGTINLCSGTINGKTVIFGNNDATGKIYTTSQMVYTKTVAGSGNNGVGTISKNDNLTCN